MFGLDAPTLAVVVVAFLAGGVVKGILGIGLPLVIVPSLAIVMPTPQAVALMVAPTMVVNVWQAWQGGAVVADARRFWPLMVPMVVATVIGAQFLTRIDPVSSARILGAIVILFSAVQIFPLRLRIPDGSERWAGPVAGLVSGIVGGVSNLFGPPVVMYVLALGLDKERFVGTLGLLFAVGSAPLYLSLAANGVLTADGMLASAAATVPALAAVAVGQRLRAHISQLAFARLLIATLFVMGINLMLKGLV